MEQNIADFLKDAFSEVNVDFEHLQLDEGTNTSESQLLLDWDNEDDVMETNKVRVTSDQDSVKPVTDVYEEKDDEETSNDSEDSELNNPFSINTESASCLCYVIESEQDVENIMTEAQQINQPSKGCTAQEGSMQSIIEGNSSTLVPGVSMISSEGLNVQEALKPPSECFENPENDKYQILIEQTYSASNQTQTLEETLSGSDEEESKKKCKESKKSAKKQPCPNEFDSNKENQCGAGTSSDLKEFTEEDQEQIEESLADYPSDLSHSEGEECHDSTRESLSSQEESSFSIEKKEMKNSEEQNLQDEDHQTDNSTISTGINDLELETMPETADINVPTNENAEDVQQEFLTNYINPNKDAKIKKDVNDQSNCHSDLSSDDNITNQEKARFLPLVNNDQEWKITHGFTTDDLVKVDNDHDCTCPDTEEADDSSSKNPNANLSICQPFLVGDCTQSSSMSCLDEANNCTELYSNIKSEQLDAIFRDHAEASDTIKESKTLISDMLWSSELLMDKDDLYLDEYDWDLTGEDIFDNLDEGQNLENTDKTMDTYTNFENKEEYEQDWEQEKIRIEAFYKFYGNQDDIRDEKDRNHRVTFCMDHESSKYDSEDDSDSSEEELDNDSKMPVQTMKSEYHSDSDEPQEKPFSYEKTKMKPREQQCVSPAQKQHPPRNRCLSVLKTTLALGLVTAIGVVSFWLATENLEWIH